MQKQNIPQNKNKFQLSNYSTFDMNLSIAVPDSALSDEKTLENKTRKIEINKVFLQSF